MEKSVLNLEEAAALLEISEKTLIKLLKEEHIPARKLGREWRFNRDRLIQWLADGDSNEYSNQSNLYITKREKTESLEQLLSVIDRSVADLREHNNIKNLIQELPSKVSIPQTAEMDVIYKQKGDVEKLEFKISWLSGEYNET